MNDEQVIGYEAGFVHRMKKVAVGGAVAQPGLAPTDVVVRIEYDDGQVHRTALTPAQAKRLAAMLDRAAKRVETAQPRG